MEGGPPRANAAQLAARKIKEKPKMKRTGTPRLESPAPQFPTQTQSSGGLFGGSVQSSGAFNFSGPAAAPSFPPATFGSNTNAFGGSNNNIFGGNSNGQPSEMSDRESDRLVDDRPAKRQFGVSAPAPQHNGNTFQMPNAFTQGSPASTNIFTSSNPSQGGSNIFGAASATPSTNIFANPSTTQNQPPNPFSFSSAAPQPAQTPSISFGSGPATDEPTNNLFNFNQPSQPPQSPAPTTSIFNKAPTISEANPPNPIFSFASPVKAQGTSAPSSTSINFGSVPASESPAKDLFQNPQPPKTTPSSNMFGPITPAVSKPQTSNLFGNVQTTDSSTTNIFAKPAQASTNGTNNIFAQSQQTGQTPVNLFSSSAQVPPGPPSAKTQDAQNTANIFGALFSKPPNTGEQDPQPQPTSNGFEDSNKPTEPSSNLFGNINPQAQRSSNTFASGNKPVPTPQLFGSPDKPLFQPFAQSNVNGVESDRPASPKNPPTLTSDLFSNLNKPLDETAAVPKINGAGDSAEKASVNLTPTLSTSNIFGTSSKPVEQPAARSQTSVQSEATKFPGSSSDQSQTSQKANWAKVDWGQFRGSTMEAPSVVNSKSRSSAPEIPPFMEPQSNMSYTPAVISLIDSISNQEIDEKFKAYDILAPKILEKAPSMTKVDGTSVQDIRGDPKEYPKLFPGLNFAKTFPTEYMARLVPENFSPELRIEFYVAYRMKVLNNEMRKYFETVSITDNIMPAVMFYNVQRNHILRKGTVEYTSELDRLGLEPKLTEAHGNGRAKRLATNVEDQEHEPPAKRTKPSSLPHTAQTFNGLPTAASSGPANSPQSQLNGISTTSPSAKLSQPGVTHPIAPSPSKAKRKGDDLDQDMPQPKRSSPLKQINMQNLNGNIGGSNTSNLFKEIVDSPAKPSSPVKPSPERKTFGSVVKPANEAPRFNPFGNLPVPPSATADKEASSPAGNMFHPKPISSPLKPSSSNPFAAGTTQLLFPTNTQSGLGKSPSPNPFATSSSIPDATAQKPPAIKPPTFGILPLDGMAQFAAKASQDAKDNEQKLLEKAIDEDWDEDEEDEETFTARWKQNRAAELKKLEEVAKKGKGFQYARPNDATPKSPIKATEKPTNPTFLFGQKPSQDSSGSPSTSLFGSRTSTPGPISSAPESVLDSHTPGKSIDFGNNIFAKYSSDPDSGKDGDADEESADEDADGESDSENKDPNYQPGQDGSGPGTPASETGEGIASAKKSHTSFNFAQAKSVGIFGTGSSTGTSTLAKSLEDRISKDSSGQFIGQIPSEEQEKTPSRSLEDRIAKDSDGNIIRQIPSEEKENTQPSTTNIFASMKNPFASLKSPEAATDQTWKPDSPIRFGTSTPNSDAKSDAPSLSVTAATPTKASNPFGTTLFGSSKDSNATSATTNGTAPAPFSNLFGNASKPSVGFGFGTSSTTSSLFPSAAVSASTSRATTPGGTTDGESGVEGDPDAERQEQLDLTSGGPGEEDEEVLHAVRAKAQKYVTKDGESSWEVKGVGPFRVLKNKDTKTTRMLLRGDPSGKIIFNKGLLPKIKYEAAKATIKVTAASEDGKGLETWLLQVKTPEAAQALADVLESNKSP